MTAEIAILNKQAVALAADSAVSTSDKIFRSANKIFSLSKVAPVAIMIYSHAEFCGIPWETVIKEYRKYIGFHKYDTVSEYVHSFFEFIQDNPIIVSNVYSEDMFIRSIQSDFIYKIEDNIRNIIAEESKVRGKLSAKFINERIRYVFEINFESLNKFSKLKLADAVTFDLFKNKFGNEIRNFYEKKLTRFESIIPDLLDKFMDAIYKLATRAIFPLGYSGIVFAGFGEKELYPSVETYHLGGFIDKNLQVKKIEENCRSISTRTSSATVIPFAQDDIIAMFVEGIHPDIKEKILETFKTILGEQTVTLLDILNTTKKKRTETKDTIVEFTNKIQKKLSNELDEFVYRNFIYPIMNIISILPPNELANLAESLINLTSIKRQVSLERETVGGPTDVALISKGDGLIWIKRKHYFDPDLNHHFFKNYFNDRGKDEQKNQED